MVELLEDRRVLAAVFWDGGGGDHYASNPFNWLGDQLPSVGDMLVFDNTSDLDCWIDANFIAQCSGISIGDGYDGTINIQREFEIAGDSILAGGTIAGAVNLTFSSAQITWTATQFLLSASVNVGGGAVLTWDGAQTKVIDSTTLTIESGSTVNWLDGNIQLKNNASIINQEEAIFVVSSNRTMAKDPVNGSGSFANYGTFEKTGGQGTTIIEVSFDHQKLPAETSLVKVNSGNLEFRGNGFHNSQFVSLADTEIRFTNGTHTTLTGATFSGPGKFLVMNNATIVVPANQVVVNSSTVELTAVLKGAGIGANASRFNSSGKLLWNGGRMEAIIVTNAQGAMMEVDTVAGKTLLCAELVNLGTLDWKDGDLTLTSANNVFTKLTNYKGLFRISGDGSVLNGSAQGQPGPFFGNVEGGVVSKTSTIANRFEVHFVNDEGSKLKLNGTPMLNLMGGGIIRSEDIEP